MYDRSHSVCCIFLSFFVYDRSHSLCCIFLSFFVYDRSHSVCCIYQSFFVYDCSHSVWCIFLSFLVQSWTEVHFSHILRICWGSFASESGGASLCECWLIVGKSYTTCSVISSPISRFPQMVFTGRPYSCSQYLSSGWWPLLRRPIVVSSLLTILLLLCDQDFLLLCHRPGELFHWRFSPLC